MPEHMLLRPVFHEGELVAFAATIGHMAEIGAVTVGSFAATATEVYQEGLRLPPVKLVRAGEPVEDVWKIILSNHRTPRSSWGDLHAMIGSLELADRRLQALLDRHGAPLALAVWDELLAHGERLMRRRIEAIPDGEYAFEDVMEGDGHTREPVTMRVRLVVEGDRAIVDYTGSDPQARGPVNATFGVTVSATCNAFLQVSGTEIPRNAGDVRLPDDDRAAGLGRERPLPRPVGRRQHRDAAEARRDAARRARRGDARAGDGRRGRDGVQLPLRRRPPGDRRAVRALPLRGERLGRPRRRRRAERAEPRPRQLPQHADRGLRDALPVPHALVRAHPGLGRPRPPPRRPRRAPRPRGAGAGGDGERDARPRRARRVGAVRRPAGTLRGAARAPRRRRPLPRLLRGVRHRQPVEARRASCCAQGDVVRIESAGGGGFGDPRERDPELVLRDVARASSAATRRSAPTASRSTSDGAAVDEARTLAPRRLRRLDEGAARSAISKMPSISTEIANGSAPMPTAERACGPRSGPKISTSRSEAPFATFGCSPNSGSELTSTSSFTTRRTRSSSPISAFRLASRLRIVSCAACLAGRARRPRGRACP